MLTYSLLRADLVRIQIPRLVSAAWVAISKSGDKKDGQKATQPRPHEFLTPKSESKSKSKPTPFLDLARVPIKVRRPLQPHRFPNYTNTNKHDERNNQLSYILLQFSQDSPFKIK